MTFETWKAIGIRQVAFEELLKGRAQKAFAAAEKAELSVQALDEVISNLTARFQRNQARVHRHVQKGFAFVPVSGRPS